jgi:hypothetical protein
MISITRCLSKWVRVQYPAVKNVGVRAVTSTTGGLHINQLFHPVMLMGIGVDMYLF